MLPPIGAGEHQCALAKPKLTRCSGPRWRIATWGCITSLSIYRLCITFRLTTTRCWCATLVGGGPTDEFRKLAENLGIVDNVSFLDWVDEAGVKALCAQADVLVLPSNAEGLAMSILEGMSHGLAVIATTAGAHSEVIEPEESGLFVLPGDVPGADRRRMHPVRQSVDCEASDQ